MTARSRTFNVTCTPVNDEDRPDYGDAEIVHMKTAWDYGPKRLLTIPVVSLQELQDLIQGYFPDATFTPASTNNEFDSWRLRVSHEQNTIEYAWGPISGFGGIDLTQPTSELTFEQCDVYFNSILDAEIYASENLEGRRQNEG